MHEKIAEIQRLRKAIWLWIPIGAAIYFVVITTYQVIFGDSPGALFLVLNFAWAAVYWVLASRLSKVRCPKCGDLMLRPNPLISTKNICCKSCGHCIEATTAD